MTEEQKSQILEMRKNGCGYKTIGAALKISNNTVKSFCQRNGLGAAFKPDDKVSRHDARSSHKTEIKSGTTVFIISTGYSENATESLEEKLKSLILKAATRETRICHFVQE